MSEPFINRRRQVFLQEEYAACVAQSLQRSIDLWSREVPQQGENELHRQSLADALVADDRYWLLSLRYTAGAPIEPLRADLAEVVAAYERYQRALGAYENEPRMPPLGLDQLGDYERCLQLVGLCYLLHRRDLLPRIAALVDPGYRGEDTLYEDLLAFAGPGRIELDAWYHELPYTPLVHAMYEPDRAAASALLKTYCEHWYPAFEYIPWHDGHKRMGRTDGDYFGYWAFEAGAVALLCEIDDSAVGHLVYPKDLVAWAREHAALSGDGGQPDAVLRCEAGAPCPQAGRWTTPAAPGRPRHFAQGEILPEAGGDYGITIWRREDAR